VPAFTAWVSGPSTQIVAAGQVLVAGDGDQVADDAVIRRAAQAVGHVLDETRLAAAGRPLEQDRQPALVRRLEDADLVADRQEVRLVHIDRRILARITGGCHAAGGAGRVVGWRSAFGCPLSD
jgi:hypothetical protein